MKMQWWWLLVAGCYHLEAEFVPKGVTQEIGVNHLAEATHRWTCEGDEQLGTLPNGKLFIASQDFQVPQASDDATSTHYAYRRETSRWAAAATGAIADFNVPADPERDVSIEYGSEIPAGFDIVHVTDTTIYYGGYGYRGGTDIERHNELVMHRRFASIWSDRCWPASTELSRDEVIARLYRGIAVRTEAPPGRHFRLKVCASNIDHHGFVTNRTTRFRTLVDAMNSTAGGPDMAFAPHDYWITDDGHVTVMRNDGLTFELTSPAALGGSTGWLFERAQSPPYVNGNLGEEAIYIYPPHRDEPQAEPRPLLTTPRSSSRAPWRRSNESPRRFLAPHERLHRVSRQDGRALSPRHGADGAQPYLPLSSGEA